MRPFRGALLRITTKGRSSGCAGRLLSQASPCPPLPSRVAPLRNYPKKEPREEARIYKYHTLVTQNHKSSPDVKQAVERRHGKLSTVTRRSFSPALLNEGKRAPLCVPPERLVPAERSGSSSHRWYSTQLRTRRIKAGVNVSRTRQCVRRRMLPLRDNDASDITGRPFFAHHPGCDRAPGSA